MTTANSRHNNGVNVGFTDGSVRFIAYTIDRTTWRALGTRNDSETVNNEN